MLKITNIGAGEFSIKENNKEEEIWESWIEGDKEFGEYILSSVKGSYILTVTRKGDYKNFKMDLHTSVDCKVELY